MGKIKVFLGGYVNSLNAQNINCRALSEHLDKSKFIVATMLTYNPDAKDFRRTDGVLYFMATRPMRLFKWVTYLKGILWADIAYLPKLDCNSFCLYVAKMFKTKVFTTLEGILDDVLIAKIKNPKAYIDCYRKFEPNLYSITRYIVARESKEKGFHFSPEILYLGVDTSKFIHPHNAIVGLKNIVFIGNDLIRKNCIEFLETALLFPDITFHVVGGNMLTKGDLVDYLKRENIKNVIYHGRLDHTSMANLLTTMDLMFFPSRSEGFPKVMLETACIGVPTLCYNDYGADEWITTGVNGFVVATKEEAYSVINHLKNNPAKLKELSRNAVKLGKAFDWSILVKEWEKVLLKIYYENRPECNFFDAYVKK